MKFMCYFSLGLLYKPQLYYRIQSYSSKESKTSLKFAQLFFPIRTKRADLCESKHSNLE